MTKSLQVLSTLAHHVFKVTCGHSMQHVSVQKQAAMRLGEDALLGSNIPAGMDRLMNCFCGFLRVGSGRLQRRELDVCHRDGPGCLNICPGVPKDSLTAWIGQTIAAAFLREGHPCKSALAGEGCINFVYMITSASCSIAFQAIDMSFLRWTQRASG